MDKDLELAATNPAEFLSKPQPSREWNMSIDDVARAINYNPAETLLTKAEQNPQSYGWLKTIFKNVGEGMGSLFSPETGGNALVELYSSPNMTKEKADRLIEDVAYTRYFGKKATEATRPIEQKLAAEKHPHITGVSQGIGQFISQTLVGTINPAAAISTIYSSAQQQMEEGLVERYVENTGGIEGYAGQKRKDDFLVGGFAAFNTLIERGLGTEALIERAFRNPSRATIKSTMEQMLDPTRIIKKQALKQAGKQAAKGMAGEATEEFAQTYLETGTEVAAGYRQFADLVSDEQLQSALTAAAYGGIVGGVAGYGLHKTNRIVIKKRINDWAKKKGLTLSDSQVTQIANDLIDETQDYALNEITTISEINNHYGQAYETVKKRIGEVIDATGTTPWTDQNKSKEEYIKVLADSITIPAINMANIRNMPLEDFLEIADVQTAVTSNIAWLKPISKAEELDEIIEKQNKIIKDQTEAKKLGVGDDDVLKRARQRKAIAERARKDLFVDEEIKKARHTRRKEQADYITAQDLQPEQIKTLDTAIQAQEGQDYVLFGGLRIPVEYQVVELADVQPSHINGLANPKYSNKELQNRASRGTTQDVADLREKASNITPERLMKASTSAEGAPVVNANGEVIAGNGRTEIIRYAYENPQTAEKYKQELVKQGFNIDGMQHPVLIRRNTTMTEQEQVAAADISNISETSAFDEASQARQDIKYLKDSADELEFAVKLPMSERRGLMQNNGKWNKRKVRQRYEDAVLAWLCGNDTQLFENLVLDRGLSFKVLDILTSNGSLIYETATKYPGMELREDLYHALVKMQRATKDNFLEVTQQLELDGHDVMPENTFVWSWLFADATTNRQFLQQYTEISAKNREAVNAGADMFGQTVAPLSKKDALIQALKKADQAKAEAAASRGKEYKPLFNPDETTTDMFLAAAIASYNNQFAPQTEQQQLFKLAFVSGTLAYTRPSTKYVLRGGEGQIVHGWGVYLQKDQVLNSMYYRSKFARSTVFVRNMPEDIYQFDMIKLPNGTELPKISSNLTDEQNITLDQTLITLGAANLAEAMPDTKATPYSLQQILHPIIRALHPVKNAARNKLINDVDILDQCIHGIKDQPIDNLTKIMQDSSKIFQDIIKDTAEAFGIKINEITPSQLSMAIETMLEDAYTSMLRNTLFTDEIMQQLVPNQTNEFYDELVAKIQMAISGINPLRKSADAFDNTTLANADATVLEDFDSYTFYKAIELIKDTLYDGNNKLSVKDSIISNKEYDGVLGLLTQSLLFGRENEPGTIMRAIANGSISLEDIENNGYYKELKERADIIGRKLTNEPAFIVSILNSAKKLYAKQEGDQKQKTWSAITKAFRNMNKTQRNMLLETLDEEDIVGKTADLLIEVFQNPHNIKRTRGQQLAVEIPEAVDLLNEDTTLADQPSAQKIRAILEDFVPGGLVFDFIERTDKKAWNIFRKQHKIPETSLIEFNERVFEEAQAQMFGETASEKLPESGKLLVDYMMANMKGEDLYLGLINTIPETYIELKSGEVIGEEKDYDSIPEKTKTIMSMKDVPPELARDVSLFLNDNGIKGIMYEGGRDDECYVIFSDEAMEVLERMDDEQPMYYQKKKGVARGIYDPELQAIILTKYWNETTFVHEYHHRFLEKMWNDYKLAQNGQRTETPEFLADMESLFKILEINPAQDTLTVVQQEKFATMVEAYLTGLGVDHPENLAFQAFLHWIPEQYKSILDLGYLDENGEIQNPILDQESIDWFNKWFANPFAPSLSTSPEIQHLTNATDANGQIIPSTQKIMNNREKDWGQDSEQQIKADSQLYRAIDENIPTDMRAAMDGEKERAKAETRIDDTILPEEHKPTIREKWFKTYQPDARERAAAMAREYLEKNPEKARELAFADPETTTEFEAPVDRGMLIRAVMETVSPTSDDWFILNDNLATVKSMSGSTLSLSGDLSHQAYLDAKREVEMAREVKAAVNYAGTRVGALEKWNEDIRAFLARRTDAILKTAPNSEERKTAIKAMLEEAKTKFSANTTNAVLNQLDLTGMQTKNKQAFIKWAEKQIKQASHAKLDTKEQKELMEASIKAQIALKNIDSTEQIDGKFAKAAQAAQDIRHWQAVKDKIKKAYIGRWGKFGLWMDNFFGGYMPSAMLMSLNTLFFANVPSTAVNTFTIRTAALAIGKNKVEKAAQKNEIERIKQIFNASSVNLAQMDKPTSPSTLHGEKYLNTEQKHWYNFTFEILGRTDNMFRIPTFVDALARIATKDAGGDKAKATVLFKEYAKLNNQTEEAQIARKQALAVANMAVFTQDGMLSSALNHIRSQLNHVSRGAFGLDPNGGFGLGNILAPFLKTGANITEMGLSATLAIPRTAVAAFQKYALDKEIPDMRKIALSADWINVVWTAVMVALLAALSGDDDEWYKDPYEKGKKYDPTAPYDSIRFGKTWVKLDIFGPMAIPLRTAAMVIKDWEKKKLASVSDGLFAALSDTPLVQQFTDSSLDYMTKQPGKYWSGFAYNQANKLMPAQVKTITRAASRATGATLDTEALGKTIDRKFHRNYGLDGEQLTTNDLINILTNRLKYVEQ